MAATNNVPGNDILDAIQEGAEKEGVVPREYMSLATFYAKILQLAIEGDEGKLRPYLLDKSFKELNRIANGALVLWNMAEDLKWEEW